MQFKVPQFLEIEDKIFGPFTFREFIYLVGGGGLCFILYKLLGLILGAIPILVVGGFSIALTFYRPNSKPFIEMVESGFKYFTQSKLYIWKRKMVKTENNQPKIISDNKNVSLGETSAKLNGSRLRDLAWSLDVLDLSKKK
jgi:hypothetical protein